MSLDFHYLDLIECSDGSQECRLWWSCTLEALRRNNLTYHTALRANESVSSILYWEYCPTYWAIHHRKAVCWNKSLSRSTGTIWCLGVYHKLRLLDDSGKDHSSTKCNTHHKVRRGAETHCSQRLLGKFPSSKYVFYLAESALVQLYLHEKPEVRAL